MLLIPFVTGAQIATDGTVGPAQALTGPAYTIPDTLGTQVGTNLFHSFSAFNVNNGESATFTSGFAGVTDNVISRVTGNGPSTIDGLLRNSIPGSDFWFVNPNGVLFGAGASLDMTGSFHVSSADFLELGDCGSNPATCGRFDAGNPAGSSLTVAAPSAFGFLDDPVGPIRGTGNAGDPVELAVPMGESLSLVGDIGTVAPDGSASDGLQQVQLEASEGRIDVVSVGTAAAGGEGLVRVAGGPDEAPALSGFDTRGPIALQESDLLANGTNGGRVFLRGSTIVVDGSSVNVNSSDTGNAGRIAIDATDFRMITTDANDTVGSALAAESDGFGATGTGGRILLRAQDIEVRDGGSIEAETRGGAGGFVEVFGDNITVSEGVIRAGTRGAGAGGKVFVAGYASTDSNPTPAATLVVTGNDGNSSNDVATGDPLAPIEPRDFGTIRADSVGFGNTGIPGVISVIAESLTIDGGGTIFAFNRDGTDPAGGRGLIDVQADNIFLSGGIATQTFGAGPGSDISIRGVGADPVPANSLTMPGFDATGFFSYIQSGSSSNDPLFGNRGGGRPGNISILARDIDMDNEAQITNGISAFGLASSSNFLIDVSAENLTMRNGAFISSNTSGDASAGIVTLNIDMLTLTGTGTRIEATSRGQGAAGDITIGSLQTTIDAGLLTTTAFGSGRGGSILIETDRLDVLNGGRIDTSSRPNLLSLLPVSSFDDLAYDVNRAPDITYSSADGLGPLNPGDVQAIAFGQGRVNQPSQFVAAFDVLGGANTEPVDLIARSDFETIDDGSPLPDSGAGPLVRGVVDAGELIALEVSGFPDFGGYPFFEFKGEHQQSGDYSVFVQLRPIGTIPPAGDAGSIIVRGRSGPASNAQVISVAGAGSGLFSVSASDRANGGAAGNVSLNADLLEVFSAGEISVNTIGGEGGEIELGVLDLRINDDGLISAASSGSGVAGSVTTIGGKSIIMDNGRIDATAPQSAAGNVDLNVDELVLLTDSVVSALSRDPGGNFFVKSPQNLVLQNSQILANSEAAGSGNISITANAIVIDPTSIVRATGEVFTIGTILANVVQLEAPEVGDAASPLETRCKPQKIENRSSLIVKTVRDDAVQSPYRQSAGRLGAPAAATALIRCSAADLMQ